MTHSLALLADAGHMLTDVGGLALALFAIKFGERPPTARADLRLLPRRDPGRPRQRGRPPGHLRLHPLEAYQRFRNPPDVASGTMLAVGVGRPCREPGRRASPPGRLVARASTSRAPTSRCCRTCSPRSACSSPAASCGTGWYYADPLVSAGIGLFIFPRTLEAAARGQSASCWRARRPTSTSPPSASRSPPFRASRVCTTCTSGRLTSAMNALSVHVVLADGSEFEPVSACVSGCVRGRFKIGHVTIQVERAGCADEEVHL